MSNESNLIGFNIQDSGVATLTKITPRVKGDGREYDIDLVFEVESEDVNSLAEVLPGVIDYHTRAIDETGSAVLKYKPAESSLRVSLTSEKGKVIVDDVSATLRNLTLTLNPTSQRLKVPLRLLAQTHKLASPLVSQLNCRVVVSVTPAQVGLFENLQPGNSSVEPKVGDVVCGMSGDDTRYGRVIEVKGSGNVLIDDLGQTYEVDAIMNVLKIRGRDEEDLDGVLNAYTEEVQGMGEIPSWKFLVVSLGQSYHASISEGQTPEEEDGVQIFRLGMADLPRAIQMHLPLEA